MTIAVLEGVDTSWVDALPELDDKQTGALRRILNLSGQLSGDWSGMMNRTMVGEDFGALRFQLAYMSYTLALAHVHRLPAAPGVFRKPFDSLIQKMLLPDCWMYWSYVSTGNGLFNEYIGPQPQRWNPVAEDNIMYSAYVQSMALLYHYLFRDDKYAADGALTFEMETLFWNKGGFKFPYNERELNDLIYWQMASQGFLGVACEPDCIFQICNQPNILGFRMHDLVYGGDLAEQATKGYVKAWEEFGMLDEKGNFKTLIQVQKRSTLTSETPGMNYWLMTLLHAWYPDLVRQQYPVLMQPHLLDGPNGARWIKPHSHGFGKPDDPIAPWDMSWGACLASEVGDTETLEGLFAYADQFMNPTWENGAYYYKRRDVNFDEDGYFIGCDSASGNAMYNYARLNVENGLKKLYDGPLTDSHFSQPALVGVPDDIDVRRAWFEAKRDALVVTLGAVASERSVELTISLPDGRPLPAVIRDGKALTSGIRQSDGAMVVVFDHSDRTTLLFQW